MDQLGYTLTIILGVLLGYVRNNMLLSQDYDLDVIINPNDYNRIMLLKPVFKSFGYTLYGKNDNIPHAIFGNLYSKTLVTVSMRLYNDKTHYYIEFFENYVVSPGKVYIISNCWIDKWYNYQISQSSIAISFIE